MHIRSVVESPAQWQRLLLRRCWRGLTRRRPPRREGAGCWSDVVDRQGGRARLPKQNHGCVADQRWKHEFADGIVSPAAELVVREAGRAASPGDRDTNIAAAASLRSIAGDCGLAESSVTRLAPLVGSGQVPTAVIDADAAGATYLLWTDPSVGQGQGPAERASAQCCEVLARFSSPPTL